MAIIFCTKLKKDSKKMSFAPFPNDLGTKILNNISQEGWDLWIGNQTILINEYRLNMMDKKSRDFLKDEMNKFLFSDDFKMPEKHN